MPPKLPIGTKFFQAPLNTNKKYKVIIPLKNGKNKTVLFGSSQYEHYHDMVPKNLGGGIWTHKDHNDKKRRDSYRKRHGALTCKNGEKCISVKYSPAWFSYHFLW
jgi:hypothetical protein